MCCSSVRVAFYCFFNRWKCFRVREGCCNTLHQNQPHFPVHASILSLTVPRIPPQQGSLFPPFKCNATFSFQIETIPGELNPCGGYGVFHPTCACVCASAYASGAYIFPFSATNTHTHTHLVGQCARKHLYSR